MPGEVTFSLLSNLENELIAREITTDNDNQPDSRAHIDEKEDDEGILLC